MNKKFTYIFLLLGLYFISFGISYAIFGLGGVKTKMATSFVTEPIPTIAPIDGSLPILTGPKDQVCPLNGALYTQTEKDLWLTRRPLLVMVENHEESRPQSGLSRADIVYEAVSEGAITRFMGVFYCGQAAYAIEGRYDVGPVRSARTYFLDWASEYADYPLYAHVGGANCSAVSPGGPCTTNIKAQALEQIQKYGWLNKGTKSDLNQFALSYSVCRREPDRTGKSVATEHSMYCSTDGYWSTAQTRGLTNVTSADNNNPWDSDFRSWLFKDDEPSGGSVSPEFDFWRDYESYRVKWEYDLATNSYKRFNGNQPHLDFNTQKQIMTKNVVVQFTEEKGPVDEHKHMLYTTIGTGSAQFFFDGKVTEGTWSKKSRTGRTLYYNSQGKEVEFNRGQIWIEIIPKTGKVTY